MTKDMKVNCNGGWQVLPDVNEWRFKYEKLLKWVQKTFYAEWSIAGVAAPNLKVSWHNGYGMKDINNDTDLKITLISARDELEIWVDIVSSPASVENETKCEEDVVDVSVDVAVEECGSDIEIVNLDSDSDVHSLRSKDNVDESEMKFSGVDDEKFSGDISEENFDFTADGEEYIEENDEENFDFTSDGEEYIEENNEENFDFTFENEENISEDDDVEDNCNIVDENDGLSDVDGNCEGMAYDSEDEEMVSRVVQVKKASLGIPFKHEPDGKIHRRKDNLFEDVYHFRRIIKDYLIQEGFDVNKIKNEKTRVTLSCKGEACPWRLHASTCPDGLSFKIKTLTDSHSCVLQSQFKEVTDSWIAEKLMEQFRADPNKSVASIAADLLTHHKIQGLNKTKLVRARNKARRQLEGDHVKLFAKLPGYAEVVLTYNPRSIVKISFHERIDMSDPPMFKRMFLMLGAVKNGFLRGCRPWIGVDGCFLRGPYEGILLVAVSLDACNGIVPLACAVVEAECKDSWLFFLQALKTAIGEDNKGVAWTFMSDRQKGLIEAVGATFPSSPQCFCCRHIDANMRVRFKVDFKKYFWRAANSYTKKEFEEAMTELKTESIDCHEWLSAIPSHLWSRHGFQRSCKVDHITNNMTESFNNWINAFRHLPFLSLFEEIRLKTMRRFHDRYQKSCTWEGGVCPKVRVLINKKIQEGRCISVIPAGLKKFQVIYEGVQHIVDLERKECSCEEWDLTGIPCKHGTACIMSMREDVTQYVHEAYLIRTYQKIYTDIVNPQPDVSNIPVPERDALRPPLKKRRPGRPKNKRVREPTEDTATKRSSTLRCSKCKQQGHNKRTCNASAKCSKGNSMNPPSQTESNFTYEQVPIRTSQTRSHQQVPTEFRKKLDVRRPTKR